VYSDVFIAGASASQQVTENTCSAIQVLTNCHRQYQLKVNKTVIIRIKATHKYVSNRSNELEKQK